MAATKPNAMTLSDVADKFLAVARTNDPAASFVLVLIASAQAIAPADAVDGPALGFDITLAGFVAVLVPVPYATITLDSDSRQGIAKVDEVAADRDLWIEHCADMPDVVHQ